jgi:pimeloyl-ACP methyl ester carboxylesterase
MATFVLVHGSWAGSWCWSRVSPLLRERGHVVHEQTLTGMGDRSHLASRRVNLSTHIADVVNTIRFAGERVVLVGHSYAGFVATGVADEIPESLSRLIYLDANIPKTSRSSLFGDFSERDRDSYKELVRVKGEGWKLPMVEEIGPPAFDISKADLKMMRSLATPQPARTYSERLDLTGRYREVPRTFIKCEWPGNPFDVGSLREQGMEVVTINSGHWPMLSCPSRLASTLDRCGS